MLQGVAIGKFGTLQLNRNRYRTVAGGGQLSQLPVPRTNAFSRLKDDHAIPLDTYAIVKHYSTPLREKQGRDRVDSVESRQSKATCQSASHSTAPMHSAMGSKVFSPHHLQFQVPKYLLAAVSLQLMTRFFMELLIPQMVSFEEEP